MMAGSAPHWLSGIQTSIANDAQGHGVAIATLLGIASILIGLGVWTGVRAGFLAVGALLSLAYWVFGQSLGGPFWAGNATDVNTGPLLALLALTLMPRLSAVRRAAPVPASARAPGDTVVTA